MKINFKDLIRKNELKLIWILLIFVSISSFIFFFSNNSKNLPYADAISRLNIARKVVDNITPGLTQVGNVWLPLPQIMMLPFIWNNYLWHSGIAGYIMSGSMFVLCGLFIYKSAKLITNSIIGSLCSLGIFALNINILYLQTTAMSESIFMTSLAATIYFFLLWFQTKKQSHLILAAISVSAMTLIRYEGLAVLIPSLGMVFAYSYISDRKYHNAESNIWLYSMVACLGFALWTLFLAVIFGDPLYWRTYYATPQATGGAEKAFTQAKPFLSAVWQYFTSFVWMIGIVPTIFAIVGTILMGIYCWLKKSWLFMPLLLPLGIFLFMVLTLMRNTPIVQPDFNISTIISGSTSLSTGFNIRYGILLLPWVAIISAFVFRLKPRVLNLLIFLLMFFQFHTYYTNDFTTIYKIPDSIYAKPYSNFTEWLKQNYDGGKILISAGSMEDQMFQTGFNYKEFIHEGTDKYWKESLDNPSRYAKWVIIDYGNNSDTLARHMNRRDILEREYNLIYQEKQLEVWKKNEKTYFEIK
jgi:hypothetical protein